MINVFIVFSLMLYIISTAVLMMYGDIKDEIEKKRRQKNVARLICLFPLWPVVMPFVLLYLIIKGFKWAFKTADWRNKSETKL